MKVNPGKFKRDTEQEGIWLDGTSIWKVGQAFQCSAIWVVVRPNMRSLPIIVEVAL